MLTHKAVFLSLLRSLIRLWLCKLRSSETEERECLYCHKPEHVIENCLTLKQKEQRQPSQSVLQPKCMGLMNAEPSTNTDPGNNETPDACSYPFVLNGLVLTSKPADLCQCVFCETPVIPLSMLLFSEILECCVATRWVTSQGQHTGFTGFFPIALLCCKLEVSPF